jgi:hypothetical protein
VVSIPACHAGDPGSIPGNGEFFCVQGLAFLKGDLAVSEGLASNSSMSISRTQGVHGLCICVRYEKYRREHHINIQVLNF